MLLNLMRVLSLMKVDIYTHRCRADGLLPRAHARGGLSRVPHCAPDPPSRWLLHVLHLRDLEGLGMSCESLQAS